MLDYIILGFLLHSEMSGYDIKRFMQTSTANFYEASFGSIYPMLGKMEQSGLVSSNEFVEGGKYRKLYSITDAGRKAFLEWLEQPIELNRDKHTHLVRIFFYGWLKPEKVRELVGAYISAMEAELGKLKELEEMIKPHTGFYEFSTLDFGKGYYEFNIDWCRSFLQKLNSLEYSGELTEREICP